MRCTPAPQSYFAMSLAYEIRDVHGKGRGMFSTRQIAPGETILVEHPTLMVVPLSTATTVCASCTKLVQPGSCVTCAACQRAVFCSPACEAAGRADPGIHSPVICTAYQTIVRGVMSGVLPHDDEELLDDCKLLSHALAIRDAAASAPEGSPEKHRWASIMRCCGDSSASSSPSSIVQAFMRVMGMDASDEAQWRAIESLIRKDDMNTFALLLPQQPNDSERRVRAYAMYNECSTLNHDCMPNAARCDAVDGHVTGDDRMIIRAIQSIQPGQEISISYAPLDWAYEERAEFFHDHYGFKCGCERCWAEGHMLDIERRGVDPASVSGGIMHSSGHSLADLETYLDLFFIRYVCPGDDCGGTLVPDNADTAATFTCNVCGEGRTHEDFMEAMQDLQHGH